MNKKTFLLGLAVAVVVASVAVAGPPWFFVNHIANQTHYKDNGVWPPYSYRATKTVASEYSEDCFDSMVTWSLPSAPSGMTISGSGQITWTNPVFGLHTITVKASGTCFGVGSTSDTESYTLNVC